MYPITSESLPVKRWYRRVKGVCILSDSLTIAFYLVIESRDHYNVECQERSSERKRKIIDDQRTKMQCESKSFLILMITSKLKDERNQFLSQK